jgi:hypothetical protein
MWQVGLIFFIRMKKLMFLTDTASPFIKPNKQMLEVSGKKKNFPYKKGPTFKIKIK